LFFVGFLWWETTCGNEEEEEEREEEEEEEEEEEKFFDHYKHDLKRHPCEPLWVPGGRRTAICVPERHSAEYKPISTRWRRARRAPEMRRGRRRRGRFIDMAYRRYIRRRRGWSGFIRERKKLRSKTQSACKEVLTVEIILPVQG